jgi:hypothetical protein
VSEVIIMRAVRTCIACPSQWDAWDLDGNYWYLRYRHGHGTAERQPGPEPNSWTDKPPNISFNHGDRLSGSIGLEEFCERAGLNLVLADGRA